ncbi:MAG: FixH family protein [Woeseiaceae bacterium]|nr:FixH family protein [Woeseiaceae bacterium]
MASAFLRTGLIVAIALLTLPRAYGHGGVVEEYDLCVINIGYLKAHFKIYVPQESGHEQYCEDIPVRGESIFVMEYLHEGLSEAAIDFRIIENTTGKGTFARLADVEAIEDLDAITVRYEPPSTVPEVFTLLQGFEADGEYIGIVTAATADGGKRYTAVFPFEVGYTGIGYWPWIVAAVLVLQLNYWLMSRRRARRAGAAVALLAGVALVHGASASELADAEWTSRDGRFVVQVEPELEPLVINRIHAWTLRLKTADGAPVTDATLSIEGGMPEHDHGLPTAPRVVSTDGEGGYRIEGMRFHMRGAWEVDVSIDGGGPSDVVTIEFTL